MVYHGQAAAACESLRDLCEDCRDLLAEQAPRIIGVLQDTQAVELAVEHREHLMQGVGFVLGRLPPDAMLETVGWRLDACVGKEEGDGDGGGRRGGDWLRRYAALKDACLEAVVLLSAVSLMLLAHHRVLPACAPAANAGMLRLLLYRLQVEGALSAGLEKLATLVQDTPSDLYEGILRELRVLRTFCNLTIRLPEDVSIFPPSSFPPFLNPFRLSAPPPNRHKTNLEFSQYSQ